jgi:hypothetical protein
MEKRLAEALRRIVAEYGEIIPAYSGQARELLAAYDRDGGWHYPADPEKGWQAGEMPEEHVEVLIQWERDIYVARRDGLGFFPDGERGLYAPLRDIIAWRELPAPAQRRA